MSSNKGSCGHNFGGLVITRRMIRDVLGFNGPLSVKGLEIALKMPYAAFAQVLSAAIDSGVVSRRIIDDVETGKLEVYSTDWVDDVKGRA